MALHDVAAERRTGWRRKFEVQNSVGPEMRERGAGDGLGGKVGGETWGKGVWFDAEGGEADAVDCDAVASVEARGECGSGDGNASRTLGGSDGEKGTGGFDESSEHENRVQRTGAKD